MKKLLGTQKQIIWAEDIRAKYFNIAKEYSFAPIDNECAAFWIEFAKHMTNLGADKALLAENEAYKYIKAGGKIEDARKMAKAGKISKDAYEALLIHRSFFEKIGAAK